MHALSALSPDLIESLLWEEESTTLDFKSAQYPFSAASDDAKSELLKDILAFANAFRRQDAYILIGVREVRGGRSEVVGVNEQLQDNHLQQFVSSKTQRPVTFAYRATQHDGRSIGVIHVPLQQRPLYLNRDYGLLKKNVVYLRRGSATGEASPDEVARMGAEQYQPHSLVGAQLEAFLVDRTTMMRLADDALTLECLITPAEDEIPDYKDDNRYEYVSGITGHAHRGYYRELATYTKLLHGTRALSFAVRNMGSVTALDVRLVFDLPDPESHFLLLPEEDFPSAPKARTDAFYSAASMMRGVSPPATVNAKKHGTNWNVELCFGKIQPQEVVVVSHDLFIGALESGPLVLSGKLYADNLPEPAEVSFEMTVTVTQREVSLQDLLNMKQERFYATPEGQKLLRKAEGKTSRFPPTD